MICTLLSIFFLNTEIASSSISSERATYDGNALVLKGAVCLQHSLGEMQSGNARLIRQSEAGGFSRVHLKDAVHIHLKNRGQILCEQADFDFDQLKGKLIPKRGNSIRFENLCSSLVSLASKEADIEFAKKDDSLTVAKIEANRAVHVQYKDDFFLTADSATFSNTKTPYIWASPNCVLTHCSDQIEADRVEVLPESEKVILTSPTGILTDSAIAFSCNKLIWEQTPQILTMKGNVAISDSAVGDMICEDEVEFKQHYKEGKWLVNRITSKGKTELNYNLNESFLHLLICYGQMQLDHDRLILTLESPSEQPLEYYHDKMKLIANHAEMSYSNEEGPIIPEKLLLCGNIELTSPGDSSRCALADNFSYFPEERRMVLSSKKGNVLFWDQKQDLKISAKEVHITQSERGENIKGIGSVRFAFSSTENELLRKMFPFYVVKGGSYE